MTSAALVLLLAGALAGRGAGAAVQESGVAPLEFRGPGRDAPEPDVKEVVLGFFGPGEADHPEYGEFWRGATLALEQENAAGGYRGKPFRLEAAWSESPWAAGILDVTRLVYDGGAWAVIGGVDGTTTHLAVQLALKSYFLLLSPGSTDVTADRANVPWLFSLPPSDARIAPVLAEAVAAASAADLSRSSPGPTTTPTPSWWRCAARWAHAGSRQRPSRRPRATSPASRASSRACWTGSRGRSSFSPRRSCRRPW